MSGCDWLFAGWTHHSAGQPTKTLAAYMILAVSFCSSSCAGILCTLILCRGSLISLCVFVMLRGLLLRVSLHCDVTSECVCVCVCVFVCRQIFGQYNITVAEAPAANLQWCVAAAL